MTGITELEAINVGLVAAGGTVVTSPDVQAPDVLSIKALLVSASKELQQRGWWFNREYELALAPDPNGVVIVPQNTLAADPSDPSLDYVLRGTSLYDRVLHTSNIGVSVKVDVIIFLPFDQLPFAAQAVVQYTAAQDFVGGDDGDLDEYRKLGTKLDKAFNELKREHLRSRDLTVRTNKTIGRVMSRRTGRVTTRFGGARS